MKMNCQPGVIARLMGMDAAVPMLPVKAPDEPPTTCTSIEKPPPFMQAKCGLLSLSSYGGSRTGGRGRGDSRRPSPKKMRPHRSEKKMRPRSRQAHHPQEHLLQKIKEDFQSWQASMAPETVAASGNLTNSSNSRCIIQIVAQENLRKEKMSRYGYGNNKHYNSDEKRGVVRTSDSGNATKSTETIRVLRVASHCENLLEPPPPLPPPSSDMDVVQLLYGLPKVKRDDSMEVFLQEVKERLQKELKVNLSAILTWGNQPKNLASKKRLSRSEAFRLCRRSGNHTTPTEHAHRQKNVSPPTEKTETKKDDEESVDSFPGSSTTSTTSRGRVSSLTDLSLTGMTGFDGQTCQIVVENRERKLVRSFSAPELGIVSPSSVGSTDHGIAFSESGAMNTRTSSFSLRETVSSLMSHRFSLTGKLFGRNNKKKKNPSYFQEPYPHLSPSSESFRLYNFPQANSAELAPSRPVSPLETITGHSSRRFFSYLNSEQSRNSPSEFEDAPASELSSFRTDITVETACNQDKAYLRELLIAAGLYDDGSLDNKANVRVDSTARPICDYIFDQAEDVNYYRNNNNSGGNTMAHRRMLFDLANEALEILLHGVESGSSLRRWVIDSTGVSRGRKLVDDVWKQVQALRYPQMQEMQTIESMAAFEVRKSMWAEVLHADVYTVGRKIERAIFDELIEQLLSLEVFNSQLKQRFLVT